MKQCTSYLGRYLLSKYIICKSGWRLKLESKPLLPNTTISNGQSAKNRTRRNSNINVFPISTRPYIQERAKVNYNAASGEVRSREAMYLVLSMHMDIGKRNI